MASCFQVWYILCRWVFLLSGLFRVLILFTNCLFIRPFCDVFGCHISVKKTVQFPLHPVIGMFQCHFLPLLGRILVHCFGKACFVCIVLLFIDIYFMFLFSPVLFPSSCIVIFSCIAFNFLFLYIQAPFFCFIILAGFRRIIICVSRRISHLGFDFFFVLFEKIPIFSQNNFAPE